MTQRERVLATIVGGLVILLGVALIGWRIYGAFARRDMQVQALAKQKGDNELKIKQGLRSGERLQQYANRALPADPDLARMIYKNWLVTTVAKVGLKNHKVTAPQGFRNAGDVYTVHTFKVVGEGNVQQLTDLLYDIYASDVLHRVQYLSINPLPEKKELQITLMVEALAMPTAPDRDKLSDDPSQQVAGHDREYYRSRFTGRNLFAPQNQAPVVSGDDILVAYRGQRFEFTAKAEDPDKMDTVKFEADVSKLPGAEFSTESGQVQWTPSANGDYQMTLIARDDGFPSREAKREFKISVKDPPVASTKPTFDAAKHAYITGVTESNGEPEVWVMIRTEGRTLRLNIGEAFKIGEMEGKIAEVNGNRVIIEAGGERITTRLGQPIVQ